jgi:septal ring factor EnvC (AmiA/AmiB activator)
MLDNFFVGNSTKLVSTRFMTNTSSGTGLPTRRVTQEEEQNSSQMQSEPKLPRNEITLIKKLSSHPDKAETRESMKQIESQIVQLQTHVIKTENAVKNALANIKSKKKSKKKGKKFKK